MIHINHGMCDLEIAISKQETGNSHIRQISSITNAVILNVQFTISDS